MATATNGHLEEGDLSGWIDDLAAGVKAAPSDAGARLALAQALMARGELERADTHLDLAMSIDPEWAPKVSLVRHLLRALKARDEVFAQGRAPEILSEPGPYLAAMLKANAALRDGDADAAAGFFEEAEALRPAVAGERDGAPIDEFRDLDDRTAGLLEVATSNGKYYWIEIAAIESLAVQPVSGFRDTFLRQIEIDVRGGPSGVVFVPTIYWSDDEGLGDAERLGRTTSWIERERPPVIGVGRRCVLIGDDVSAFGEGGSKFDFRPAR